MQNSTDDDDDAAVRWMTQHLRDHLSSLEKRGYEHHTEQVEGLEVSRRIVNHVMPTEPFEIDPVRDDGLAWQWVAQTTIAKALGILRNRAAMLQYLGPAGPTMPTRDLHPVVWGAAENLWKIEHYRAAVARAATFLNAHIQDRSTRLDLSDKDLMGQVFSDAPASEDRPRLRWRGLGSPQTRKSMTSGLAAYAQGVFLTIRNPATHETGEVSRQTALEQLAALSLLGRWVDECVLDRGEAPSSLSG